MTAPTWLVHLASERAQVAKVAERWKAQYCSQGQWARCSTGSSGEVHQRLSALSADATAQDVAEIIGNDSWIGEHCDGCRGHAVDSWQIGEAPDYESHRVVLCSACMDLLVKTYKVERMRLKRAMP